MAKAQKTKSVPGGLGGAMVQGYSTPAGNAATAPSRSRAPKSTGGSVRRMEIEPADNGIIVTCYYKEKAGNKGEPYAYTEPTKHAFADVLQAVKFIAGKF